MRRRCLLAIPVLAALVLGACGDDDDDEASAPEGVESEASVESEGSGAVTVHVLTGLEDVVNQLVETYEADAGVEVDVVAEDREGLAGVVADEETDFAVALDASFEPVAEGLELQSLGRNLVVIAVPADNPEGIDLTAFAADSASETRICGADTPFGNFTVAALEKAGVTPDPATVSEGCEEEVLAQVAAGELDAGLMFRGGVEVPEGVEFVEVDEAQNVVFGVSYVVLSDGEGAMGLGEFIGSPEGQEILTANGYLP